MKNRLLVWLCSLALCTCGLTLAACGSAGSEGGGDAVVTEEEAPQEEAKQEEAKQEEAPVDPNEKFLGEWKLALMESQGLSITGDLSEMLGATSGVVLKINEDSTGSLALGDEGGDFTWDLRDDNTITMVIEDSTSEDAETTSVDVAYADDVLSFELKDEENDARLSFTKDGTIEGYDSVTVDTLTDFSSNDQLVGSWNMCGITMGTMTAYGDPETIASLSGLDSVDLEFSEDGTTTFNGSSVNWGIGENGAYMENGTDQVSLKASGDYLVMDMTEYLGKDSPMLAIFARK